MQPGLAHAIAFATVLLARAAAAGDWVENDELDSADLAVAGWQLLGTTSVEASSSTVAVITYWSTQQPGHALARCVTRLDPQYSTVSDRCWLARE